MDVRFAAPELEAVDALKCEALALPFFSDERPLHGVLGLLDWRMCGYVSRMISQGKLSGQRGETVLLPARPRMTLDKVFLFGLGEQHAFEERALQEAVGNMLVTISRCRVRICALVLPGRNTGCIPPETAMEGFVRAFQAEANEVEFFIVDAPDAQRAIQPIVDRERRKARATVD